MTKRFKELYIDSKGIVSLKDNGILKLGELNELENLLNTLDEKSKELENDYETLKLQDEDRREYQRELEHKLDTLTGLWVTDQTPTHEDIKKYYMWRIVE